MHPYLLLHTHTHIQTDIHFRMRQTKAALLSMFCGVCVLRRHYSHRWEWQRKRKWERGRQRGKGWENLANFVTIVSIVKVASKVSSTKRRPQFKAGLRARLANWPIQIWLVAVSIKMPVKLCLIWVSLCVCVSQWKPFMIEVAIWVSWNEDWIFLIRTRLRPQVWIIRLSQLKAIMSVVLETANSLAWCNTTAAMQQIA